MRDAGTLASDGTERSRFHGAKLALFLGRDLVSLLRDDRPDIPWPGHWDLPGGGREGQESPEACALRELHEELGLCLSPRDLRWARAYRRRGDVFWFFVVCAPHDLVDQIRFGDEGQRWQLMSAEAYLSHPLGIPQFQARLRDYLRENGDPGAAA